MKQPCWTIAALVLASFSPGTYAAELPPLARTPPMGWATWYGLRCNYDAAVLTDMARKMVSKGLAKAGYTYFNVDDCWATSRNEQGDLVADMKRFPAGMATVAGDVHRLGLKFGIYTSAGGTTCQRDLQTDGNRIPVGSKGHEYRDAKAFAAMGADFIKVDWCGRYETQDSRASFETWRDAIAATGRPMLLSICEWGYGRPWEWGRGVGHMWRLAMDTLNCWSCTTDWGAIGVVQTFDQLALRADHGGVNGWNDPDVLMIGNGMLTPDEERAQMSIYAIAAAPLIAAADLRTIRRESLDILTHAGVIAINQDKLGKPGKRIRTENGEEVWVRELAEGRRAVVLFNRNREARQIRLAWSELDLAPGTRIGAGLELWSGKSIAAGTGLSWQVPGHGAAIFMLEQPEGAKVRAPI
jgi:alpha-galactosidase